MRQPQKNILDILAVGALTLGIPAVSDALPQQRPAETFAGEVEVSEVLLDALVTDREGSVVLGLGPEDFRVTEDGRPVDLTEVTFYSNRTLQGSPEAAARLGVDPATVPTDRWFVLLFHDARSLLPALAREQMEAGRKAKEWVRGDLLPNDRVAVVSYDFKLKLHQDFTADRAALERAIDDAVIGDERGGMALRATARPDPSLAAGLPQTLDALRRATTRIYGAIEAIADAVAPIPGRKNLVMFSIGFGETGSFGLYTPDPRFYPDMTRAANDANLAIYTIDLLPLAERGRVGGFLSDSLSTLAADTGGVHYRTFVSFRTPLAQIAADNSGYYLLAYTGRHPAGERGFQPVDVRVTNPEFRVRSRAGYLYGEAPADSAGVD